MDTSNKAEAGAPVEEPKAQDNEDSTQEASQEVEAVALEQKPTPARDSKVRRMVRRYRGPVIYGLLCLAILLGFRERAWQHLATLNGDEWQPIQDLVRPNRQGDEPICFLPSWTRGHAVDQNKYRGIDTLEDPSEAWEGRDEPLPGFWVVSQFGVFDPDDVPADIYPHREARDMGGAMVYVFRREPFDPLPDTFAFHIRDAACVLHSPGEVKTELVWRRMGYALDRSDPLAETHTYLGCKMTHARFSGRPHFGIWFHPPPVDHALSLTWPAMEVTDRWLVVSGGFRDSSASRRGQPIKLRVVVNGKTLSTLSFPRTRGWKQFGVSMDGVESPARISFKGWTKNNHSAHFSFNAAFQSERPHQSKTPRAKRNVKRPRPRHRPSKVIGRKLQPQNR